MKVRKQAMTRTKRVKAWAVCERGQPQHRSSKYLIYTDRDEAETGADLHYADPNLAVIESVTILVPARKKVRK